MGVLGERSANWLLFIAVGAGGRLVGMPVGGVVSGICCMSSFILRFDVHLLWTIRTCHNLLCWSCHPF